MCHKTQTNTNNLYTIIWFQLFPFYNYHLFAQNRLMGGGPRGVMVKAMDCGIVVSEFILQSRYCVHFWTNTLGKGVNLPYPPSYGLNSTTTVLLGE